MAAHVPFVVLTGWATEPHRRLAMELGVDQFLPLPVRPRELLAIVSSILGPDFRAPASTRKSSSVDHRVANGL